MNAHSQLAINPLSQILRMAVLNGIQETVFLYIRRGEAVNATDGKGRTLLMLAASRGHVELCRFLLDAGADPTLLDVEGWDATAIARANGHDDIAALLDSYCVAKDDPTLIHPPALLPESMEMPSTESGDVISAGDEFDLSTWEEDEDSPPPAIDESCLAAASTLQYGISAHVPIDTDEDWSDIEIELPEVQHQRHCLEEAGRTTLYQLIWEGLNDGCVPRRWVDEVSLGRNNEHNQTFEEHLEYVLGQLGIIVDESPLEWRGCVPVFFGEIDEEFENTINEAIAFLNSSSSGDDEPYRRYVKDIRGLCFGTLLSAAEETDLGRTIEIGLEAAVAAAAESAVALAEIRRVGEAIDRSLPGYDPAKDKRHFLYKEYLRVISRHWPAVFVMENVKGMLSAKIDGKNVFQRILEDLSDPLSAFMDDGNQDGQERYLYSIWPLATRKTLDLWGVHARKTPDDYLVESERYGIPQARHRIFLLGIRSDIDFHPDVLSASHGEPVPIREVLMGLPKLRSGIARTPESRKQWRAIAAQIPAKLQTEVLSHEDRADVTDSGSQWKTLLRTAVAQPWFAELEENNQQDVREFLLQILDDLEIPTDGRGNDYLSSRQLQLISGSDGNSFLQDWLTDPKLKGVCNHATREHMPEDHYRYLFAAAFGKVRKSSPKLRDFPASLLPKHRNVPQSLKHGDFNDRFRVQVENLPATTIMSHIAKDGHYFIHPDPSQARSLTVREAARIQTFPDNYYFCGNRSEQYVQVGNAVPPLLAREIAKVVAEVISAATVAMERRNSSGYVIPNNTVKIGSSFVEKVFE